MDDSQEKAAETAGACHEEGMDLSVLVRELQSLGGRGVCVRRSRAADEVDGAWLVMFRAAGKPRKASGASRQAAFTEAIAFARESLPALTEEAYVLACEEVELEEKWARFDRRETRDER